jgi:hypothetical protein
MPGTLGLRVRAEPLVSALVAVAIGVPLVLLGPPAGDLPAHLYRTELVREGVLLWDTFWYAGHYPLASYSLLYYFPAALVGNELLTLLAVVGSAVLFASLAMREWGVQARWPSRAFALAACGPLFTGTYAYALGVLALLACLKALQLRRTWLALLCAALTLGFSPLAFLFLSLVLLAVFVVRGRIDRIALAAGAGLLALGALQGGLALLFPLDGRYPFFRAGELAPVLGLSLLGCALALRAPGGRVLAALFALWALAALVAFAVPSPIGENVTRLRGVALPLALLAAGLARYRPRWLALPAVVVGLVYTLTPYVAVIPYRTDGRPAERVFWEPALSFLRTHASPDFRVEVVPTGDHWEAYWLPHEGFPLARGWYRQLDIARNPLFYEAPLQPVAYRSWLRSVGVRYVVLPETQLGRVGEEREAALLRTGRSGLREVFRSETATIWELPEATPILAGPGDARLTLLAHDRVAGETETSGSYRLAVRFTPYWRVDGGDVCVERAPDGMTRLVVRRAGAFALGVGIFDRGAGGCP